MIETNLRQALRRANHVAHRLHHFTRAVERNRTQAVVANEIDVAAFLARHVVIDDHRKLRGVCLGE